MLRSFANLPLDDVDKHAKRARFIASMESVAVPTNADTQDVASGLEVIMEENQHHSKKPEPYSEGNFAQRARSNPKTAVPQLIKGLQYRGCIQYYFFSVFVDLHNHSLINLESMASYVNFGNTDTQTAASRWVLGMLECFERSQTCLKGGEELGVLPKISYMDWLDFQAPIFWLSAMIVRTAQPGSMGEIYQNIIYHGRLGAVDDEAAAKLPPFENDWIPNPLELTGPKLVAKDRVGFYGYFLPDDIAIPPTAEDDAKILRGIIDNVELRYSRIWEAFERLFPDLAAGATREK